MARIYYLIPDLFRPDFSLREFLRAVSKLKAVQYLRKSLLPEHKAVGGIKVMYQHCLILQRLGYRAEPLLLGKYQGNYFGYNLSYKTLNEVKGQITEDDIVVSTEFEPYDGLRFRAAKKVLFMQNWFNLRRRLKPKDRNRSYLDLGYDSIITCGDYCTQMVKEEMSVDAFTITNFIDQTHFFPMPEKRVLGRVMVLSRKNYQDFVRIRELSGEGVDFRVVDGLTQDQIIDEFRQADVFLATGYPEGLPLPPLEAMNCGCVVVGFTGGGAREYMIDGETAMIADDGDCETAAAKLLRVLRDETLKERLRERGYKKALTFTEERTEQLLDTFFRPLVS